MRCASTASRSHGVQHDPLLYSYLLDPTYSTYGLREIAQRRFNLKLAGSTAEAADITLRLTEKLREQVEAAGLLKVYDEIDLPLVAGAGAHGRGGHQDRLRRAGRDVEAAGPRMRHRGARHLREGGQSSSTSTRPSSLATCCSTS